MLVDVDDDGDDNMAVCDQPHYGRNLIYPDTPVSRARIVSWLYFGKIELNIDH